MKNIIDVPISLCSFLCTVFAKYAPVTFTIGKSIVKSRENEVFDPNVLAKNAGTHCVTLSFSVP